MSMLDSSMSALQSAMTSASTTAQDWSQSWDQAKNALIQKAAEFTQLYNRLRSQAAVANSDPQLSAEYQALMAKGDYIKSTVSSITQSFDSGANWFSNQLSSLKNMIGLDGVPKAGLGSLMRLNGLGILPLIPIAVIVAATSAIVYWLTDAYTMKNKLDLAEKVHATGGDIDSVLNSGTFGGGFAGLSKNLVIIAAAGAAIYFLWPKLKKIRE